ncbi:MAG: HAMP domain-containing sensor histidine kinase [Bacteroidia bacterium]
MGAYEKKKHWKTALFVAALLIGISSLWYTNYLVEKLAHEEKKRIQLWAAAYNELINLDNDSGDLTFESEVIKTNETIPVILADENDNIIDARNFDSIPMQDEDYLREQLREMKAERDPIVIEYGNGSRNFIYYKNSNLIAQLTYYPYIQLFVISLFVIVSYLAFSASRRYEQNRVWVGMSKETAHQLGTPISSLMAWTEYLNEDTSRLSKEILVEIEKDIERLNMITERFSKIGSEPVLIKENVADAIEETLSYLRKRVSRKVTMEVDPQSQVQTQAFISRPLFAWVVENLVKNAVDAMSGEGRVSFHIEERSRQVLVDIKDTGRGIPKSQFNTIFNPGFTTRKRGWGLGLSLVKRIVEIYHRGAIYVKTSELGTGTTFRIKLNK